MNNYKQAGPTWNRIYPWLLAGGAGTGLSTLEYDGAGVGRDYKGDHRGGLVPHYAERVISALMHTASMRAMPKFIGGLRNGGVSPAKAIGTFGAAAASTPVVNFVNTTGKDISNMVGKSDQFASDLQTTGATLNALMTGDTRVTRDGTEIKTPVNLPDMLKQLNEGSSALGQAGAGLKSIGQMLPAGAGAGLGFLLGGKLSDAFVSSKDEVTRQRLRVLGQLAGAGLGGVGGYVAGGGKLR